MAQSNEARDVMGTVAHMKKKGTLKIFIIIFAVGALLFIIGSFILPNEEEKPSGAESSGSNELIGFFEYKEMLEREQFDAPKFSLNPEITNFYDFKVEDVIFENYQANPTGFKIPVAV